MDLQDFIKQWDQACSDEHDIDYVQNLILEFYGIFYPELMDDINNYLRIECHGME